MTAIRTHLTGNTGVAEPRRTPRRRRPCDGCRRCDLEGWLDRRTDSLRGRSADPSGGLRSSPRRELNSANILKPDIEVALKPPSLEDIRRSIVSLFELGPGGPIGPLGVPEAQNGVPVAFDVFDIHGDRDGEG